MTTKGEYKNKLRSKIDSAANQTDELLKEDFEFLMKLKQRDLEGLIPNVTDRQKYEQLIATVEESSKQNEDIAQLQARLKTLGGDSITLAKQLIKLVV